MVPSLTVRDFTSRGGLLWPPAARDVARMVAAADGGPILDHGAGSGLLAALLSEHAKVVAFDPVEAPWVGRFHPVARRPPPGPFAAVVSSWMEAGMDLRADVAAAAPVVVSVYDAEGGCGVKGDLSYARWGRIEAARWLGPSFEDVEEALQRRGRGLPLRSRNVIAVWAPPAQASEVARRIAAANAPAEYPWEGELARLGAPRT